MSERPSDSGLRERLSRADGRFLALCLLLLVISIAVVVHFFSAAFPEIAIDFRVTRDSSRVVAERFLAAQRVDVRGEKHAVRFDSDETARVFLERTLGLEASSRVLRDQVRLWSWHHRWYQPLVEEEVSVDVAPTGEITGFTHRLPESAALISRNADAAGTARAFLASIGVRDIALVEQSERRLPQRIQRIVTFESTKVRPGGASYRHHITIDGDEVTGYSQGIKVPDAWLRSYRELRSKNVAAGSVDMVLIVATMIGAVVVFVMRLRRGDLSIRFLLGIGLAAALLTLGVGLNSMPSQFAWYDTNESYGAFLIRILLFGGAIPALGSAMMLIVVCGAGEVLYRERLPNQLAMPRLWTPRALTSKRVFRSMILGYALVPAFMAYQAIFYLVAKEFGAWSPAELPYDETLNTAFPWIAVLFAGFYPAVSEEFLSRAFSIPFLQRFVRSRWFAIILSAFIWGFGHSTYPNQPFWIRGVEVGIAGIVAGLLMDRFGLLPLLIWHYTIDAVYTATLLFASGNTYYIVSAGLASLIFAVPLVLSIALYIRNRGFVPDDDLTNASMPVEPAAPPVSAPAPTTEFPPPVAVTRPRALLCAGAMLLAGIALTLRPPSPNDAIEYRIPKERAKEIARTHVQGEFAYVIAAPVPGFRSWNRDSTREDGGSLSGGSDNIAATHLLQTGSTVTQMQRMFQNRLDAALWTVRFFTPQEKEEIFVELEPRGGRIVGYHKYQDEAQPGASLTQGQALAIARDTFATFSLDVARFEVKEALSFQQPKRRDWLFHFEERTPLGKDAFLRATVRVAGDEVTQFQKNIKIPESVYRRATEQGITNILLFSLQILGAVTLLALVITGLVVATRAHGLPWRRALRWTAMLAILPLLVSFAGYEESLFSYQTSVAWETFRIGQLTEFVSSAGLELSLLFLALAGLDAALPYALQSGSREGRARFGRSAALAALTAVSLIVVAMIASQFVSHAFPSIAEVHISLPQEVGTPFPAFVELAQGLMTVLIASAAVALFTTALRTRLALVTITAVFFVTLDPSATTAQMPLMLLRALATALLVWFVARYVLGRNPLAWPLTIFLALMVGTASTLIRLERPDLVLNAAILLVAALAALLWSALSRRSPAVA